VWGGGTGRETKKRKKSLFSPEGANEGGEEQNQLKKIVSGSSMMSLGEKKKESKVAVYSSAGEGAVPDNKQRTLRGRQITKGEEKKKRSRLESKEEGI